MRKLFVSYMFGNLFAENVKAPYFDTPYFKINLMRMTYRFSCAATGATGIYHFSENGNIEVGRWWSWGIECGWPDEDGCYQTFILFIREAYVSSLYPLRRPSAWNIIIVHASFWGLPFLSQDNWGHSRFMVSFRYLGRSRGPSTAASAHTIVREEPNNWYWSTRTRYSS